MMWLLAACSDYRVHTEPAPDPVQPAGVDPDADVGSPPDWTTCSEGWHGVYANLDEGDPMVEPEDDVPVDDPRSLDWWDDVAYKDFAGDLDFGQDWWPVDEGIGADPLYFAARFTAWIRGYSDTSIELVLGAEDDAWVLVNDTVVVSRPGVHAFEPETLSAPVQAGQFPIEVRYAHRAGTNSGLRFRVVSGDVALCYPDLDGDGG